MRSNMKKTGINSVEYVVVILIATTLEIAGRKLFPNYDINYLLYGARLYMANDVPWMDVWPGLDLIHGYIGRFTGTPEASILIIGILANAVAALIVNEIFKKLCTSKGYRYIAVLVTALFFKPTLGGWTADHVSFLVGMSGSLTFIACNFRINRAVLFVLGASLGAGLLLKLNSFSTSFIISLAWILVARCMLSRSSEFHMVYKSFWMKLLAIVGGAVIVAYAVHALTLFKIEIYLSTINTYFIASQSTAAGQFELQRLAMIPLQVNLLEALLKKQYGVLLFLPLIILFWPCLGRSVVMVFSSKDNIQRQRHLISLLLILVSSFTALSLGRGLTHRMFLLPAGIALGFADFRPILQRNLLLPCVYGAYITSAWALFAYIQRDFERDRYYNLRDLTSDRSLVSGLCVKQRASASRHNHPPNKQQSNYLTFQAVGKDVFGSQRCWKSVDVSRDFAGFMHTEEIGNAIGITFQNHKALDGDYHEKWDWRKTLPETRNSWAIKNAEYINKNRISYFVERIRIVPDEYNVPGYSSNIEPRKGQLDLLVSKTKAVLVGRLGRFSLWKTQWANDQDDYQK